MISLRVGNTLRARIAFMAGLVLLAGIGCVSVLIASLLHSEMQAALAKQQLATTQFIAKDVESKIGLRLAGLQRVAGNVPAALFGSPAELQAWLDERRAIHAFFPTGVLIIPGDGGAPLADSPHLSTRPPSFLDRDWFVAARATRQPVISKPLITRATNEIALVIAVPILDAQGAIEAVVAGITPIDTPGFLDLIKDARLGESGRYQLISHRHRLFALQSDAGVSTNALPAPGQDLVIDMAVGGARGIHVVRNGREDELVAYVEIPHAGLLLIARQSTREAFAPISNSLNKALLISAMLSIAIIALVLFTLSRLLQPIANLAQEIRDIGDGTRPMHPVGIHATHEVAAVAKSFNYLQDKILQQEQRLTELSHYDTLTGLPNRLLFMSRLESELLRMQRSKHGLALLFLDLDGFKAVNDSYGHQIGDMLLTQVARRLQTCVREVDMVARLGGDEFLILLTDTQLPPQAAERVAQSCVRVLGESVEIENKRMTVGVSIGVAYADSHAEVPVSAEQLIARADIAMYEVKAQGRNGWRIATA